MLFWVTLPSNNISFPGNQIMGSVVMLCFTLKLVHLGADQQCKHQNRRGSTCRPTVYSCYCFLYKNEKKRKKKEKKFRRPRDTRNIIFTVCAGLSPGCSIEWHLCMCVCCYLFVLFVDFVHWVCMSKPGYGQGTNAAGQQQVGLKCSLSVSLLQQKSPMMFCGSHNRKKVISGLKRNLLADGV